jgi:hypothetical protein
MRFRKVLVWNRRFGGSCAGVGACSIYILVPKLRLGTHLPAKLCLALIPAPENNGRSPHYATLRPLRVGRRPMSNCFEKFF